jgi:hypothetical protein
MFKFLAWIHALLFRLVLWALLVPLKAVLAAVTLVVAWLGEEFRRWAGLAVSGALLVIAGKAVLNYAPPEMKQPLALTVMALLAVWALAVARSARYTRHLIRANLQPVRTRRTFRQLFGKQAELGEQVKGVRTDIGKGMARRARGTPAEGVFRANREARAAEHEEAVAAAQREAAAQRARAEREDWAADVNAEHDPFAKQGS